LAEFGEVYKLVADGPYCYVLDFELNKKIETKTLKKIIESNPNVFLRINRKEAININSIEKIENNLIFTKKDEVLKFSRRKKKYYESIDFNFNANF